MIQFIYVITNHFNKTDIKPLTNLETSTTTEIYSLSQKTISSNKIAPVKIKTSQIKVTSVAEYITYSHIRNNLLNEIFKINKNISNADAKTSDGVSILDEQKQQLEQITLNVGKLDIPDTPFSEYLIKDKNLINKFAEDTMGYSTYKRDQFLKESVGYFTDSSNDADQIENNYEYISLGEKRWFALINGD